MYTGPNAEVLLSLSGEGHLEVLSSVIRNTLAVMKERNILSTHSLSQIKITDELRSFDTLSFPGKITSYCNEGVRVLGIADTGHHRVLIADENGALKVYGNYRANTRVDSGGRHVGDFSFLSPKCTKFET